MDSSSQEISFLDLGNLSPDEENQLNEILYEPKDNYPIEFPWNEPNYQEQGGQGDGGQGAARGQGPVQYPSDHGHLGASLGITFGEVGDELFTSSGYSPLPVQPDSSYPSANVYSSDQRDDNNVQYDDGGKSGAKERRNKKKRPPGYYELINQKQKVQQFAPPNQGGEGPQGGVQVGQKTLGQSVGQVDRQLAAMSIGGQCTAVAHSGAASLARSSVSAYTDAQPPADVKVVTGGQTGAYMDAKPPHGGQENYGAYMGVEPPAVVGVKHRNAFVRNEQPHSIHGTSSKSNAVNTVVHSQKIPQQQHFVYQGSDNKKASQAIVVQTDLSEDRSMSSQFSTDNNNKIHVDTNSHTDSRGFENRTGNRVGVQSGEVKGQSFEVKVQSFEVEIQSSEVSLDVSKLNVNVEAVQSNAEVKVQNVEKKEEKVRAIGSEGSQVSFDGYVRGTASNETATDDNKRELDDVNNVQASQDATEIITQNAMAAPDSQQTDTRAGNGGATAPKLSSWAALFRGNSSQQSVTYASSDEQQEEKAKSPSPPKQEEPVPEPVTVSASEDKKAKKVGELLLGTVVSHRPAPLQPRGLVNRGNWCYINATLQALMACPPFYNLLKQMPAFFSARNRGPSSTPILDSFVELANEFVPYQYPKGKKNKGAQDINPGKPFEPVNVYKMLQLIKSNNFMHGKQEDAEEFLSCVLNGLHDEMLAAINEVDGRNTEVSEKPMNGDAQVVDGEAAEGEEEGEDEWEQVGRRNKSVVTRMSKFAHSPITEIFGGSIRSALYQHGSKESAILESFLTLQLDIQNEKVQSVKEAIAYLATKEAVHGFTCSKTKMEVEASRRTTLEELPPVLVLHLKCFVYDKNGGSQKVVKHVEYGVDLEVSRELLSPNVRSKLPTGQRTYKLFAVVYHHGKNATGGHYTTDIYHNGINGWMRIDDSTVKVVTVPQLMKFSPPRVPYLLYYRRCDLI